MANWCSNTVVFEGNLKILGKLDKLFKAMAKKEAKENCGQLPDFLQEQKDGYFFDIYQNDDATGVIQYETRWSPNIEIVKQIAEKYKVNFVHDYAELGNLVYGRATFSNQQLTNTFLNFEDFGKFDSDEETFTYDFENKIYGSEYDILDILLERKIASQSPATSNINSL